MDGTERELFERALRHATTTHCTDAAALDAALEEMGWIDALVSDRRTAVSVLFECQGAAAATSSGLDHVLGTVLGARLGTVLGTILGARLGTVLGARANVGAGEEDGGGVGAGSVVLPSLGRWGPPGRLDGHLFVSGLGTSALARAGAAIVVTEDGEDEVLVTVPPASLSPRPTEGIDPWLGLVTVHADSLRPADRVELVPGTWAAAVDQARLALGHELVGAAGAMLELARTHALDRTQFGRPIAAFQAVRHRLAETLVAVEGARALLEVAWEQGSTDTVAMAKAVAGRSARLSARHCQQVLAGMGFTTEHPLHRYVRRVLVLDELFGSARSLTAELGRSLVAGGSLPTVVPL
jgi:Acyl-CoA dehydrogenase, C-terminal domain